MQYPNLPPTFAARRPGAGFVPGFYAVLCMLLMPILAVSAADPPSPEAAEGKSSQRSVSDGPLALIALNDSSPEGGPDAAKESAEPEASHEPEEIADSNRSAESSELPEPSGSRAENPLTPTLSPAKPGERGRSDLSAAEGVAEEPHPLSVAPLPHWQYPDDRPEWIDAPPDLAGPVHRWSVSSGPATSEELSRQRLAVQIRAAFDAYLEEGLGIPIGGAPLGLNPNWIEGRRTEAASYQGLIHHGDETFYESAVLLEFDASLQRACQARYREQQLGRRLGSVAIAGLGMTALLMVGSTWMRRRTRGAA